MNLATGAIENKINKANRVQWPQNFQEEKGRRGFNTVTSEFL